MEYQSKKVKKNERQTFWEKMLLLTVKTTRFCTNLSLLKTCAQYGLDPVPDIDPEAEPDPQ
jgi:hypothetical protein